MARIDKFLGRSLHFANGFSLGFNWVHGNGKTSKTSAVLAAFHHPDSVTWRWSLKWSRPQRLFRMPCAALWKPRKDSDMGMWSVELPLVGGFAFSWQAHMFRRQSSKAVPQ